MSAVDDAWLMQTLDEYAVAMRWVVERKDFNAFWPVGLPRAGTAMDDLLVAHVERLIVAGALHVQVPNPTAALLLLFFSTHGMRRGRWPLERRLHYASALLGLVRASKTSPVVDEAGRHQLADPPAPADDAWHAGFDRDVSAFCALSWATAEALYFCNHRLGTERHGPYPLADGGLRMVRTVLDLRPAPLWPEVIAWPELPRRVDVVTEYTAEEARFDLFANPLFDFDSASATRRFAVLAADGDGRLRAVRDLDEVRAWNEGLRELVRTIVGIVAAQDRPGLVLRLHNVMLYAASALATERFVAAREAPPWDGTEVRGNVDELVRYYDLRHDA